MALCRSIRWKSFYGQDWTSEAEAMEAMAQNEVPFHCLKTCRTWGPDDDLVAPETCHSGRSCFERSPLFDDPASV